MEIQDPHLVYQSGQYQFPYHYLPSVDQNGTIAIHKFVHWGLDYLTYMTFAVRLISQELKAESILDIGCGDGRLLHLLSDKVPHRVGVDIMEQPVRFARAFNPGVEFFIGDVSMVKGQFHVTTLIEVMEHIPDDEYPEFMAKVAKKTLPEGYLLVSVPTTNVPINRKHHRHYNLALLRKHLSPEFIIEGHWYLSKKGLLSDVLTLMLQNIFGIILSGKWRRMVWRLHKRYTYHAKAENGKHLMVIARPTSKPKP